MTNMDRTPNIGIIIIDQEYDIIRYIAQNMSITYSTVCVLPSWFYSAINYTTIHYKHDHFIESYIIVHGRNSWLQTQS